METCQNYGKLYAFFLEFCRLFIDDKLHREIGVPRNGHDLYYYLKDKIANGRPELYEAAILNSSFLNKFQKTNLLPSQGRIHVERLDCITYLKIMRLLGKGLPEPTENCLTKIRNYLCHAPMKSIREGRVLDFYEDYEWMKNYLCDYGFDEGLVQRCHDNVFNIFK